ncbi:hypothetical protein K438DRAFT_1447843, partial [Mycena galopus ATCC 62051]
FASVYDVFEKNSETLETGGTGLETSKTLMRQMINSMATKMEIGSPMASMYVLGNPDHYKSHEYVNFSWRPYAIFVKRFWEVLDGNPVSDDLDDFLTLKKQTDGTFVASSTVDDYRFRPVTYNGLNLYEWIQTSEKRTRTQNSDASDSEDDVSNWNEDDDAKLVKKMRTIDKRYRQTQHDFLPIHDAAYKTHTVHCDFRKLETMIPNFLGGALPRADKGDREFYCMTM